MPRLRDCHNAADFEAAAKRRLPKPLFDYVEGGADDEVTCRANTTAFDRYHLMPNLLRDVRSIDMRRNVLGCDLDWPLILAPTGMNRLFHSSGERAVATEAGRSGVGYALSTMASDSIEAVAGVGDGGKIYQLYLLVDDELNRRSIDRAKAAGYNALCLTVDTIRAGNRERDMRCGLTIPPSLGIGSLAQFAAKPSWCVDYLRGERFSLPNVAADNGEGADLSTLAAFFAAKMERHISWERVEKIIAYWDGPFAIKGVQSIEDARHAAAIGATAVIISNHGGRQLDGGAATIDLIADIVDAVGDRIEVIHDGGARRGSHIVKALAMGARACMIGRPYVYSLAAFGQDGVARLLQLLRQETERTLALIGCASLDEIDRGHLRLADQLPGFLSESGGQATAAQRHMRRA